MIKKFKIKQKNFYKKLKPLIWMKFYLLMKLDLKKTINQYMVIVNRVKD